MRWKDFFLCAAALFLFAVQANAGAWPRGKGKVFVAFNGSFTWPNGRAFEYPDIYGGGYAEVGLGKRLTLGLDLGSPDYTRSSRLKAVGFLRYSLSAPDAAHQFSVDLGAGNYQGDPVVRLGASYGKGLALFSKSGWISMDANMLINPSSRDTTSAIDATLGVNLEHGKLMGLLSMHRSATGTDTYKFTPSYARKLSDKRHIEIGVTFDVKGRSDPALKLGIWQEF